MPRHGRSGPACATVPCVLSDTALDTLQMEGVHVAASTMSVNMSPSFLALRPVYYCCVVDGLTLTGEAGLGDFLRLQLKLMKNRTRLAIGSHDADLVHFPLQLTTSSTDANGVFTPLGDTNPSSLRELEQRWLDDPNKKAYVRRAFAPAVGRKCKADGSPCAAVCTDAEGDTISLYPVSNGAKTASSPSMQRCFLEVSGVAGTDDECQRAMVSMIKYLAGNATLLGDEIDSPRYPDEFRVSTVQVGCAACRADAVDTQLG